MLRVIRVLLSHTFTSVGFSYPKLLVFPLSYSYVFALSFRSTTLYYFWFLLFLFEIYVSFFRRCSSALLGGVLFCFKCLIYVQYFFCFWSRVHYISLTWRPMVTRVSCWKKCLNQRRHWIWTHQDDRERISWRNPRSTAIDVTSLCWVFPRLSSTASEMPSAADFH